MSNPHYKKGLAIIVAAAVAISLSGCSSATKAADKTAANHNSKSTGAPYSPKPDPQSFEAAIDQAYLDQQLKALIAEPMAGRLPGTPGNELAADHIRTQMQALGLESPAFATQYFDPFDMTSPIKQTASLLEIVDPKDPKGKSLRTFDFGGEFMDYVSEPGFTRQGEQTAELYVAKTYDDLKNAPDGCFLLLPKEEVSYMFMSARSSVKQDFKAIITTSSRQNSGEYLPAVYLQGVSPKTPNDGPLLYNVTPKVAEELVAQYETAQANSSKVFLHGRTDIAVTDVTVNNVVGVLKGARDEGYIITGHFDHLGSNQDGTVNTGALDNASGTAAMLAVAKALSAVENRQLTYYFVAFNGEEEGLLGAEHLAKRDVIDKTKYRVLNLDMIGSSEPCPILIDATQPQSTALADSFEDHFAQAGFEVERDSMGYSDHAAFESEGYEGLLLIEFDERYYHTVNDTYENSIDIKRLTLIADTLVDWLEHR